jgi:glutaminase
MHSDLTPKLETLLPELLSEVRSQGQKGQLPDYLPHLNPIELDTIGVSIYTHDGEVGRAGAVAAQFNLMSVMKPLLLLFLLEQLGCDRVFAEVGTQPSDQPFHSLKQLAADRGFPRNPMINSGAIVLASLVPGDDGDDRCETVRQWLNQMAGVNLVLDEPMLTAVRALGNDSNRGIAQMLKHSGAIDDIDVALDTYNQLCCLTGNSCMLAQLGLLLVRGQDLITRNSQQIVNALMLTCGVYEASADWAMRMGLPVKSGVSGGILAIVPSQMAIGIYAPAIDAVGNSVAGAVLLEKLVRSLDLSIF